MTKRLFYLLNLTWGLPLTFAGCLVALVLRATGRKPKRFGYCWYYEIGGNWGGLNLGIFFLTGENPTEHIKSHEHGHAFQNCYLGFLMPFVVCLPSAIRYWYREYLHRVKKVSYSDMQPYDAVWFERQATSLGSKRR